MVIHTISLNTNTEVGILRRFRFSSQLFLKAKEITNRGLMSFFFPFMVQKNGQPTTRIIKLPLGIPTAPTKAM